MNLESEIWKGDVLLENVELLSTVLSSQGIPIIINKGIIKKVHVNIPWKNLSSQPTIIEISNVNVEGNIDSELISLNYLTQKQKFLPNININMLPNFYGTLSSFFNKIFENLQIKIENINLCLHIPYTSLALGVLIKNIFLQTMNEQTSSIDHLKECQIVPHFLKIINVTSFRIYVESLPITDEPSLDLFSNESNFLVQPISFDVLIRHNTFDSSNNIFANNEISFIFQKIQFNISVDQSKKLFSILQSFNQMEKQSNYYTCFRPLDNTFNSLEKIDILKVWGYLHRCSQRKTNRLKFDPFTALCFLKHKNQFYKKYKSSILKNKNMKFQAFENECSKEVVFMLKQYSDVLLLNERNSLEKLDLSNELNQTNESENQIQDNFLFSKEVPNILIQLPSFCINFINENFHFKVKMKMISASLELKSFDHEEKKINSLDLNLSAGDFIFYSISHSEKIAIMKNCDLTKPFLTVKGSIPYSAFPSNYSITLSPIRFNVNDSIYLSLFNFFKQYSLLNQSSNDTEKIKRIDLYDNFYPIQKIRNVLFTILIHKVIFVHQNVYEFELQNFQISKNSNTLWFPTDLQLKILINLTGTLSPLKFKSEILSKTFNFSSTLIFSLYRENTHMDLLLTLSSQHVDLEINPTFIEFAKHQISSLFSNMYQIFEGKLTDINYGKLHLVCKTDIENATISLKHNDSLSLLEIEKFNSVSKCQNSCFESLINFGSLVLVNNDKNVVCHKNDGIKIQLIKNFHEIPYIKFKFSNFIFNLDSAWLNSIIQLYYNSFNYHSLIATNDVQNPHLYKLDIDFTNTVIYLFNDVFDVSIGKFNFNNDKKQIQGSISDFKINNHSFIKNCIFSNQSSNMNSFQFTPNDISLDLNDLPFVIQLFQIPKQIIESYLKDNDLEIIISPSSFVFLDNQHEIMNMEIGQINIFKSGQSRVNECDISDITNINIDIYSIKAYKCIEQKNSVFFTFSQGCHINWFSKASLNELNIFLTEGSVFISKPVISFIQKIKNIAEILDLNQSSSKSFNLFIEINPLCINVEEISQTPVVINVSHVLYSSYDQRPTLVLDSFLISNPEIDLDIHNFIFNYNDHMLEFAVDPIIFSTSLSCFIKITNILRIILPNINLQSSFVKNIFNSNALGFIPSIRLNLKFHSHTEYSLLFNNCIYCIHENENIGYFSISKTTIFSNDNDHFLEIDDICSIIMNNNTDKNFLSIDIIKNLPFSNKKNYSDVTSIEIHHNIPLITIRYKNQIASLLTNELAYEKKNEIQYDNLISFIQAFDIANDNQLQKEKTLNLTHNATIQMIRIDFIFVDPIASFLLKNLGISCFDNSIYLTLDSFDINPVCNFQIPFQSYSFHSDHSSPLLYISFINNQWKINLDHPILYIDFKFWVYFSSYFLQSQLLLIQLIFTHSIDSLNHNSQIKANDNHLSIISKGSSIFIPFFSSGTFLSSLNFHLDFEIDIQENNLSLHLSNVGFCFNNYITSVKLPQIFENVDFSLTKVLQDSENWSFKANLSSIIFSIIPEDITLFSYFIDNINESSNLMIVRPDCNVIHTKKSTYTFEIETDEISFILNQHQSRKKGITPLFKLYLPSMSILIASNQLIRSVKFEFSTQFLFYNMITCEWSILYENIPVNILSLLYFNPRKKDNEDITNEIHEIHCSIDIPIIMNFPLSAMNSFLSLIKNMDFHNIHEISQIETQIWLQNNTDLSLQIRISNSEQNSDTITLSDDKIISIQDANESSLISVSCTNNSNTYSFTSHDLSYPIFLSSNIAVSKKLYCGGILIQFNTPIQLSYEFDVPESIYLFREDQHSKMIQIATLKTHQKYPLSFPNTKAVKFGFSFTESPKNISTIFISPTDHESISFSIGNKSSTLYILKIVENDISSGCHIIKLVSPIIAENKLACPIHIISPFASPLIQKYIRSHHSFIIDDITEENVFNDFLSAISKEHSIIQIDKMANICFLKPDAISAIFSKDGRCFTFFKIKFSPNQLKTIQISQNIRVGIFFEQSSQTKQIKATFYDPFMIFNHTDWNINIFFHDIDFSISPGNLQSYCPQNYNGNSDNISFSFSFPDISEKSEQIKLINFGDLNIFLKTINDNSVTNSKNEGKLSTPVRCHMKTSNLTQSIVFTPLLIIINDLPSSIALQPIDKIPESIEEGFEIDGLMINSIFGGTPLVVESNKTQSVEHMFPGGLFSLSMDGFRSVPIISLLTPERSVFRLVDNEKYYLIELEVWDDDKTFYAKFKPVNFPTPLMICNCLNSQIFAYQLNSLVPFQIPPNSTAPYALDEPLVHPAAHIILDGFSLTLSFLDDTDTIEVSAIPLSINKSDPRYFEIKLYSTVRTNPDGVKILIIGDQPSPLKKRRNLLFDFLISNLHISIIDDNNQITMTEFTTLNIDKINMSVTSKNEDRSTILTIDHIQIDDQNLSAVNPVFFEGRPYQTSDQKIIPFIRLETISPADSPFFSTISFFSVNITKFSIFLDLAFLSDLIHMIDNSNKETKFSIDFSIFPQQTPFLSRKPKYFNKNITINWLQINPIEAHIVIKNGSRRSNLLGPIPSYLYWIPSIDNPNIFIKGLLVVGINDLPNNIIKTLLNEIKKEGFYQLINSMPTSSLLNLFGLTRYLVSLLGIVDRSPFSTLEDDFELNKYSNIVKIGNQIYQNHIEWSGVFSQQMLTRLALKLHTFQILPNELISNFMAKNPTGFELTKQTDIGTYGILTNKPTTNPICNESKSRLQNPRAFSGNVIKTLEEDKLVTQAQLMIQQKGTSDLIQRERIRNLFICELTKNVICITNHFLVVLKPDLKTIISEIEMNSIGKISVVSNEVRIRGKENETLMFRCITSQYARRIGMIIQSQRLQDIIFGNYHVEL